MPSGSDAVVEVMSQTEALILPFPCSGHGYIEFDCSGNQQFGFRCIDEVGTGGFTEGGEGNSL